MDKKKLYDGKAEIVSVDFQELRFTEGLTDEQIESSMLIVLNVKPLEDDEVGELAVELEASPRECKGNDAGKTWLDDTIEKLQSRKLIENGNLTDIASAVGKEVDVYQKESKPDKKGKVWVRTYLGSPVKHIKKDAALARLAKLTGGASAAPKSDPF